MWWSGPYAESEREREQETAFQTRKNLHVGSPILKQVASGDRAIGNCNWQETFKSKKALLQMDLIIIISHNLMS